MYIIYIYIYIYIYNINDVSSGIRYQGCSISCQTQENLPNLESQWSAFSAFSCDVKVLNSNIFGLSGSIHSHAGGTKTNDFSYRRYHQKISGYVAEYVHNIRTLSKYNWSYFFVLLQWPIENISHFNTLIIAKGFLNLPDIDILRRLRNPSFLKGLVFATFDEFQILFWVKRGQLFLLCLEFCFILFHLFLAKRRIGIFRMGRYLLTMLLMLEYFRFQPLVQLPSFCTLMIIVMIFCVKLVFVLMVPLSTQNYLKRHLNFDSKLKGPLIWNRILKRYWTECN